MKKLKYCLPAALQLFGMAFALAEAGEGVRVTAVLRSPFGDPVAYEADGVLLALRKRDCEGITVQTEGGL